jgi:hypothetical protein
MAIPAKHQPAALNAEEMVLAFIDDLNKEDFESARELISDDMSFKGVMGSREGGDVYIKEMRQMKMKYKLKMVFTNGDDICVMYDFTQSGKTLPGCGWYHLENGKIQTLTVIFDPRPLLEGSHKN